MDTSTVQVPATASPINNVDIYPYDSPDDSNNGPSDNLPTQRPSDPDPAPGDDPSWLTTIADGSLLLLQYLGNTLHSIGSSGYAGDPDYYYGDSTMARLVTNWDQYQTAQQTIGSQLQNAIETWAASNPNGQTQIQFSGQASGGFTGFGSNMMLGRVVMNANTTVSVSTSTSSEGTTYINADYQMNWSIDDRYHLVPGSAPENGQFQNKVFWSGNYRSDAWTIQK